MAIQFGTVDGLVNITEDNTMFFVKAINAFSSLNGMDYAISNNVSCGAAFQRFTEPVYTKISSEFSLESILNPVTTKNGNEQSPARITYCKKMGLLKVDENNNIFELTPLGDAILLGDIKINEYAFLLLSKMGVFQNDICIDNVVIVIAEYFKKYSKITADSIKNYILSKFNQTQIIKTRFDIIINALAQSQLITDEGVLSNTRAASLFEDFYNHRDKLQSSIIDGNMDYSNFIGSIENGVFDFLTDDDSIYFEFFPNLKKFVRKDDIEGSTSRSFRVPDVRLSINKLIDSIKSTGLIYSPTLIKRLAYSLMAKPFVILSGLAGSGKTQLALAFAKCLSENENNKFDKQICPVSIGADWTNREPLLGYPNALKENEYVLPESGVLQLLIRAKEDPSKPYFLILDEMNLSVVERYFADFLSAMESREPIKLWDNQTGNVPKEIELPKNVFIIGTINVDETTYMFSPKVLDRANVIEFKIAADEMDKYLGKKININLKAGYSACADMAVDFVNKANSQVEKDEKNKDVLLSFFKKLKEVNAEFGYRTVNEISRYLHFSDGELTADSAIDTAILQKLLPKLHGSAKKLKKVLEPMWQLCLKDGIDKEIDAEFNKDDFKYPESAEKIQRMYKAVVDNGFTSFAEA